MEYLKFMTIVLTTVSKQIWVTFHIKVQNEEHLN